MLGMVPLLKNCCKGERGVQGKVVGGVVNFERLHNHFDHISPPPYIPIRTN